MSWAENERRKARAEAKRLGHDLGQFKEGNSSWLASCNRCVTWCEVTTYGFRFGDDGPCAAQPTKGDPE